MKDANPRMNNKEFRAKVFDFAKQRQDAGRPVSLQDAHDLVVHAEQIEARQVTRKQRQDARRASAGHVGKRTTSSKARPPEFTPEFRKQLRTQGYRDQSGTMRRGQDAVVYYLDEHREVLKAFNASKGITPKSSRGGR